MSVLEAILMMNWKWLCLYLNLVHISMNESADWAKMPRQLTDRFENLQEEIEISM